MTTFLSPATFHPFLAETVTWPEAFQSVGITLACALAIWAFFWGLSKL